MTGIVDELERFLLANDVFFCIANVVEGRDNDEDRSRPRVSNVLFISFFIVRLCLLYENMNMEVYCVEIFKREK